MRKSSNRRSQMPDDVSSGGDFQRLEARVSMLEAAVTDIRSELKAIREDLADLKPIRLELAEIKGRLSNLPTSFQLVFMLATFVVAAFVGATGLSLAILKLAH